MSVIKYDDVAAKIIEIRNQKVILDSDVAELYGVETKRINEAVSRNLEKFPEGYTLELVDSEWLSLKSQFATSMKGGKVKLPTAFTERGLYMLATILKSSKAIETTIGIIDTFAQIKRLTEAIYKAGNTDNKVEQVQFVELGFDTFTKLMDNELTTSQEETEFKIKLPFLEMSKKITKVKK